MAEITEERILQAVKDTKAIFADGFQWGDIGKLVEEIKQGIQIKHSDLDRFGGLSKSGT